MIGSVMNLLAIIIIVLAVAAAGAVIYVAWELSSDKSAINRADRLANRPGAPQSAASPEAEAEEEARSGPRGP
jgi:flagellar basal body-associated protein FliL